MKLKVALYSAAFVLCLGSGASDAFAEGAASEMGAFRSTYEIQASLELSNEIKGLMNGMLFGPMIEGLETEIGWLHIPRLVGEINQIKVYVNVSDELMAGSGHRVGGVNFTKERVVIFNSAVMDRIRGQGTPFSRVGLEANILHEALGALGYPDENYEMSMALYMRDRPIEFGADVRRLTEIFLEEHLKRNPSRRTENATFIKKGGTSTGVGGGGDPVSLALKLSAASLLSEERHQLVGTLLKNEGEMVALLRLIQYLQVEPQSELSPYDLFRPARPLDQAIRLEDDFTVSIDTSLAFSVNTPEDRRAAARRFLEVSLEVLRSGS